MWMMLLKWTLMTDAITKYYRISGLNINMDKLFETKYVDLFWKKVDKSNSCWTWKAAKDIDGYGKFSIANHGSYRAHRVAALLSGIEIPEGHVVMHLCDNPSCCNPSHLRVGTIQENNLDKINKRRQKGAVGSLNARSKLTEEQVLDIKQRAIVGSRTGYNNGSNLKEIAKEYGVCVDTIRLIARDKTWSHHATK